MSSVNYDIILSKYIFSESLKQIYIENSIHNKYILLKIYIYVPLGAHAPWTYNQLQYVDRWRIKLNCDGTKSSRGAVAGFVLRNWKGSFILAGARYLDKAPILVAEVLAIRDGLKTALEAGFHHIEVEGDNQVVIHAIQGRTKPPWSIAPIIEDIRNLTAGSAHISFQHIYREGNRAADWIAKYGCILQSVPLTIFSTCPSREFLFLLTDDNLGRSFVRGTV